MAKAMTVRLLAQRSGFDVEDVIIELVRLGYEYAADPKAVIRQGDRRNALKAIGLHPNSDEKKKSYWTDLLKLSEPEFEKLLGDFGIETSDRARTLPRGAHAKLATYVDSLRTSPITVPISPSARRTEKKQLKEAPAVEWRTVGQKHPTQYLEAGEILRIHDELELDAELAADPIFPPGIKNMDMLESACSRPHTGSTTKSKYPTVEMAAAALVHSLVNNHPFHNGNKRTALVAMMVFLDKNNHWLRDSVKQASLYLWILEVARHRLLDENFTYGDRADREVLEMSEWIKRNSRPIERSERPISLRELRTILTRDFACDFAPRGGSGKVLVSRTFQVPSRNPLRGFRKLVTRTYSLVAASDGKEVGLGTVKALRTQLCLTEEFDIDSAIFYGTAGSPDVFIARYQRLLRDLAKV